MPTVTTNGVETYYERRGDGPPVVFVHAAVLDHNGWEPQAEALGDDYTTVTYDLRGHGRTGGSTVERYSMELFADDLDALVAALDLEAFVLCGHSTGGGIAQAYATRHPEKVAGLVLADTFTPSEWGTLETVQFALLQATIPLARLVGYRRAERAMVWVQEQVRGEAVSGDYGNVERLRTEGPPMETDEFAKVIRSLGRFGATEVDLSVVSAPALVVYGEHEMGFVKRHAARLAAELPNAVVRVVPGAGHASNLDDPAFVTALLRKFLSERVFGDAGGRSGGAGDPENTA